MRHFLISFFCVLLAGQSHAQALPAGDYVTAGGGSVLELAADQTFYISTLGTNSRVCDLWGTIRNGVAAMENNACVVTFTLQGSSLVVEHNGSDGCRDYCGMRADFPGVYLRPAPGCTPKAVASARKAAQEALARADYATAAHTLEPLLVRCEATLHWFNASWMRTDIAAAYIGLGDTTTCLHTLQPLTHVTQETDEALAQQYPPADAARVIAFARVARSQVQQCQHAP
jgi:hypothetical protein